MVSRPRQEQAGLAAATLQARNAAFTSSPGSRHLGADHSHFVALPAAPWGQNPMTSQ
jgi:hypothetical protein